MAAIWVMHESLSFMTWKNWDSFTPKNWHHLVGPEEGWLHLAYVSPPAPLLTPACCLLIGRARDLPYSVLIGPFLWTSLLQPCVAPLSSSSSLQARRWWQHDSSKCWLLPTSSHGTWAQKNITITFLICFYIPWTRKLIKIHWVVLEVRVQSNKHRLVMHSFSMKNLFSYPHGLRLSSVTSCWTQVGYLCVLMCWSCDSVLHCVV